MPVRTALLTALTSAPLIAAVPACSDDSTTCTLVSWDEGLTVDVVADKAYPDGVYQILAVADGVTLRGSFRIDGPGSGRCEGSTGEALFPCPLVADGDTDLVAGFALTAAVISPRIQNARVNIYRVEDGALAGGPRRVELRVLRDGGEMAAFALEPQYTVEEINGPECGVATRASTTLVVRP